MNNHTKENIKPNGKNIKLTVKDSVFRNLFENPKYILQLYQSLHEEDTKVTTEDIKNVTLETVFMDKMYNDLGFMIKDKLVVMVEAQSTWSMNIIVRVLLYLADTWHNYLTETKQNRYGSKLVKVPKPEFYVLYTGARKERPGWINLSETFFEGDKRFLDVNVKMLYGEGRDDIISQYVTFTQIYNKNVKQYGRTQKAVLETIKECKKEDCLREYLQEKEKEVLDIMMGLYDRDMLWEAYEHEVREEEREAGRQEGRREGRREGERKGRQEKLRLLFELVDDNTLTIERAAQKAELTVEEFEKMKQEQTALV